MHLRPGSLLCLLACASLASCASKLPPPPANFDDQLETADVNRDGKLSHDELADFMACHLFYKRDANRDNKLTLDEWWPGADAIEKKPFHKRDLDDNGIVTLDEARRHARKDPNIAATLNNADRNQDGFADWDEVNAYLGKR